MASKGLRIGKMEGAPDWYGTPFNKLDFEWSREEKLELERYCEKILKNCAEEEMTPKERYYATMQGKPKDRLHIEINYMVPFAGRTLDHWADMIKPGDIYKRPKLHVKCHLATVARYKLDIVDFYTTTYAENFFGADAKMMDYGTPMIIGKPPIKTMEDLEGLEVPDPFLHGLFPGYLWAVKELISVLKQHGADKVMPVEVSYCGGPLGTAMMGNMMMSMPNFMKALYKDPEFAKAVINHASQWSIKYGKACKSLKPDGLYLCDVTGATPPDVSGWLVDYFVMIGKAVKGDDKNCYQWQTGGVEGWLPWLPMHAGPGKEWPKYWEGWYCGYYVPPKPLYEFCAEHNLYCAMSIADDRLVEGDPTLENDIKERAFYAKKYARGAIALGVLDYWTPPEHFDRCLAWEKQYGKF